MRRHVLACVLCLLQGLQGLLCVAVGGEAALLRDLRAAVTSSPVKAPLTRYPLASNESDQFTWPKGVLLGAGLSACQAEGAYNEDGKSESVMDFASNVPNSQFPDNINVAADHYHRFREDLDLAKQMKFTTHRFSISWSRVLPTGGVDNINEKGVKYYKEYVDKVIENGMEPMVTMLHYDQPISLELSTGGFGYPLLIDKYVEFADFLFETFGDKVKYWNTFNEPNHYCNYYNYLKLTEYNDGQFYQCVHNIALAHMKTYQLYKRKYQEKQKGKVGTSVLMWPATPKTTKSEDVMAAEIFNQVFTGQLLHTLVFGDYPPVLRYLVDKRDAERGDGKVSLPPFTEEEKKMLSEGVTDFIALNVYSGVRASYNHSATSQSQSILLGPVMSDMPFVQVTSVNDFSVTDENTMKDALLWTWTTYHVPIIISENGYGDSKHAGVHDAARAAYHSTNLRSMVRTMKEFGVEVLAYYAWSLLDSFEFRAGYTERPFGLIHVDYENGTLDRTLKDSAQFFIDLNATGRVPYVPAPEDAPTSSATSVVTTTGVLLSSVVVATALRT